MGGLTFPLAEIRIEDGTQGAAAEIVNIAAPSSQDRSAVESMALAPVQEKGQSRSWRVQDASIVRNPARSRHFAHRGAQRKDRSRVPYRFDRSARERSARTSRLSHDRGGWTSVHFAPKQARSTHAPVERRSERHAAKAFLLC